MEKYGFFISKKKKVRQCVEEKPPGVG